MSREKIDAIAIGRSRGARPSSKRQFVPIRVQWRGGRWVRIYKYGSGKELPDAMLHAERKAAQFDLPLLGIQERHNP